MLRQRNVDVAKCKTSAIHAQGVVHGMMHATNPLTVIFDQTFKYLVVRPATSFVGTDLLCVG